MKTLKDRVRDQIGAEGPQLDSHAYETRIDRILEALSCRDLLEYISLALEETREQS